MVEMFTAFWMMLVSLSFFTVSQAAELHLYGGLRSSVVLPGFRDLETSGHVSWRFSSHKANRSILDYNIGSAGPIIDPAYEGRCQFFPSNASVLIQTLKYNDEGLYTLTFQGATLERQNVNLTILEVVSDPLIFITLRSSQVELRCSLSYGDLPEFSWKRDGATLANDTKYQLSEDNSSLAVQNLQKSDCGSYTCRVSNPISVKEGSYDLSIGDVCRHIDYLQWVVPVCTLVPCLLFLVGSGICYLVKKSRGNYGRSPEETQQITS